MTKITTLLTRHEKAHWFKEEAEYVNPEDIAAQREPGLRFTYETSFGIKYWILIIDDQSRTLIILDDEYSRPR